jgi:hypothetical protein
VLGLVTFAQFPWRMLTLTTVSLAVLAGMIFVTDDAIRDARALSLPAILVGILMLLGSYPYVTAQNLPQAKEGPVGLPAFMTFQLNANEMTGTTAWADAQPTWSDFADNVMAGRKIKTKVDHSSLPSTVWVGVTQAGLHTNGETIAINSQEDSAPITFNVAYYPGWRAWLLKTRSAEVISELGIDPVPPYGLIRVRVPKGEYFLKLEFGDTTPRVVGKILSGMSLLVIVGMVVWGRLVGTRRNSMELTGR